MKTKDFLFYLILGAALGAVAGAGGAKALSLYVDDPWRAAAVFALSGAIVAAGGAASTGSRRAAWRDPLVGLVLAAIGFLAITASYSVSETVPHVALVFFAFLFSALVGGAHCLSLRETGAALAACFFGGIAGLLALALGMMVIDLGRLPPTCALAGAAYGGLLWLGVAAARRLFSLDVDQFRLPR